MRERPQHKTEALGVGSTECSQSKPEAGRCRECKPDRMGAMGALASVRADSTVSRKSGKSSPTVSR